MSRQSIFRSTKSNSDSGMFPALATPISSGSLFQNQREYLHKARSDDDCSVLTHAEKGLQKRYSTRNISTIHDLTSINDGSFLPRKEVLDERFRNLSTSLSNIMSKFTVTSLEDSGGRDGGKASFLQDERFIWPVRAHSYDSSDTRNEETANSLHYREFKSKLMVSMSSLVPVTGPENTESRPDQVDI